MIAAIVGELSDIGCTRPPPRPGGGRCRGAAHRPQRALRNLVENAARHGGGARVAVRREADAVLIAIEDDGPGIPAPFMDRVFEPFFSVDPARQKTTGGAGLGLAIARRIIERQGGRSPSPTARKEAAAGGSLPPPTDDRLPAVRVAWMSSAAMSTSAGRRRAHRRARCRDDFRRAGLRLSSPSTSSREATADTAMSSRPSLAGVIRTGAVAAGRLFERQQRIARFAVRPAPVEQHDVAEPRSVLPEASRRGGTAPAFASRCRQTAKRPARTPRASGPLRSGQRIRARRRDA